MTTSFLVLDIETVLEGDPRLQPVAEALDERCLLLNTEAVQSASE